MRTLLIGLVLGAAFCAEVSAQTPARNPRGVAFACPDHATDDQHEIDIVRESDGALVQTLLGGDPPLNAQGEVEVLLNVQPVAFGRYRFVIRSVAGSLKSDNSPPSEVWERAPGKPGKPTPIP